MTTTVTVTMKPHLTNAQLDERLRRAARKVVAQGRYPSAAVILEGCGISVNNRRARSRLDEVLDRIELPDHIRERRAARRAAAGAGARMRVPRGLTDEREISARLRTLRDYRVYYGRALTTAEIVEVLDLVEAASRRRKAVRP